MFSPFEKVILTVSILWLILAGLIFTVVDPICKIADTGRRLSCFQAFISKNRYKIYLVILLSAVWAFFSVWRMF